MTFADDTKLLQKISCEKDAEICQENLEKLFDWEAKNNMKFNAKKFVWIQYGKNIPLKNSYNYLSPDMNNLLIPKSEARDLGVYVSCDGSFSDHIEHICSKVKQRSGWILRSFSNRTPSFMKWVWSVYIQPIIDYCSHKAKRR